MNTSQFSGIVEGDGKVCHYRNGLLHREDGPAVLFYSGAEEFWLNGKRFSSKEEWETARGIRTEYLEVREIANPNNRIKVDSIDKGKEICSQLNPENGKTTWKLFRVKEEEINHDHH